MLDRPRYPIDRAFFFTAVSCTRTRVVLEVLRPHVALLLHHIPQYCAKMR